MGNGIFGERALVGAHDVVKQPNYRGGGRGFRVGLVSWVQKSLRCAWLEPARHRLEQQNSPVISPEVHRTAAGALDLKAPERVTSRAPTPKPLPLGYGEAMLTIGPGRIRASFHQSRSFRITDATRLCGALWIAEAQGTRRNDYRTC